jgi:hypothetical protein
MRNLPLRTVQLLAVVLIVTAGLATIPAAAQNPITAAREAFRKAQEELKRKQEEERRRKEQEAQKPPQPQAAPTAATPSPSTAQEGASKPVSFNDLAKEEAPTPVQIGDWKTMPDVVGVHLNMPLDQAQGALKQQHPQARFYPWMTSPLGNTPAAALSKPITTGLSMNRDTPGEVDTIDVHLTQHPNAQVVWRIERTAPGQNINRATLLTALRKKYGKEAYAGRDELIWVFDEQGKPTAPVFGLESFHFCNTLNRPVGNVLGQEFLDVATKGVPPGCLTYIGVRTSLLGDSEIIHTLRVEMANVPLALRAARASAAWREAMLEKVKQEEIEKSKQVKPRL